MEEEEEEEEQEEVGREMIDCHGRCRGYGIATVVDLVAWRRMSVTNEYTLD